MKKLKYSISASIMVGLMAGVSDQAAAATGNNFGNISGNITTSIGAIPGLVSAVAYLIGVLLAVLGIMKIKDHVENPTQTPLKEGAIRLASGGALFALPIIVEAMSNTIGNGSADVQSGLFAVGDGLASSAPAPETK